MGIITSGLFEAELERRFSQHRYSASRLYSREEVTEKVCRVLTMVLGNAVVQVVSFNQLLSCHCHFKTTVKHSCIRKRVAQCENSSAVLSTFLSSQFSLNFFVGKAISADLGTPQNRTKHYSRWHYVAMF